ncbi:hypothetical protein RCL_jg20529.t1 [Rhizophagus clarus]|uniref:Uncharacterized protein n=1 Tax=Rhizophagus clarus TaxID=94130 RepID=A0A8H3LXR7_9GLOM|nr:hypothetical protein RCL_jg20529.t1 [Rhizophagus clarus]
MDDEIIYGDDRKYLGNEHLFYLKWQRRHSPHTILIDGKHSLHTVQRLLANLSILERNLWSKFRSELGK